MRLAVVIEVVPGARVTASDADASFDHRVVLRHVAVLRMVQRLELLMVI